MNQNVQSTIDTASITTPTPASVAPTQNFDNLQLKGPDEGRGIDPQLLAIYAIDNKAQREKMLNYYQKVMRYQIEAKAMQAYNAYQASKDHPLPASQQTNASTVTPESGPKQGMTNPFDFQKTVAGPGRETGMQNIVDVLMSTLGRSSNRMAPQTDVMTRGGTMGDNDLFPQFAPQLSPTTVTSTIGNQNESGNKAGLMALLKLLSGRQEADPYDVLTQPQGGSYG